MKIFQCLKGVLGFVVPLLAIACSGSDGGSSQPQTPAPAGDPTVLDSTLGGDQEVPPIAATASGTGSVTISADGSRIDFSLNVTGPFSSPVTQAHIHAGAAATNGPMILYLCAEPGLEPPGLPVPPLCSDSLDGPSGQLTGTLTAANLLPVQGISTFAQAAEAMIAGNAYINIHTQTNGGGEIRGQIGTTAPPPATAAADTYAWIGNTPLTVPGAIGVLANDPAGSAIVASDTATTQGGTVTVAADGGFNYTQPPQTAGVAFTGTDTFTYSVGDAAGDVTVSINIANAAWYVDNTAALGGDGSFGSPFTTLDEAITAAGAGDTLFVFAGDGNPISEDAAITLLPGQKLLGEGAAFSFAVQPGNPIEIVALNALGAMPILTDALAPVVTLADDNEVAGFDLQSANEPAVQATAVAGYHIHDNLIPDADTTGIELLNVTGSGLVANNEIPNSGPGGGITIEIDSAVAVNASVAVTGNIIDGSDGGGINLRGLTAGAAHQINAVVTDNQVTNSVGGILLRIEDATNLDTLVAGNTLQDNFDGGVPADFEARAQDNTAMCLELSNNGNAADTASFDVRADNAASIQFFELGNDAAATVVGAGVTPVAAGTCGLP